MKDLTHEQVDAIKECLPAPGYRKMLGERYGLTPEQITQVRRWTGYGDSGMTRAILTPDQVRRIRAWPRSYGYRQVLAKRYGVSVWTIDSVRRGKSWRRI